MCWHCADVQNLQKMAFEHNFYCVAGQYHRQRSAHVECKQQTSCGYRSQQRSWLGGGLISSLRYNQLLALHNLQYTYCIVQVTLLLKKQGYIVVACCRQSTPELDAAGVRFVVTGTLLQSTTAILQRVWQCHRALGALLQFMHCWQVMHGHIKL